MVLIDDVHVSWLSKKQTLLALPSTEAELIALVECVKPVRYVEKLTNAFGLKAAKPMTVFGDNKASPLIAEKGVISHMKHLDTRQFLLKDLIEDEDHLVRICIYEGEPSRFNDQAPWTITGGKPRAPSLCHPR